MNDIDKYVKAPFADLSENKNAIIKLLMNKQVPNNVNIKPNNTLSMYTKCDQFPV